MPARIDEIVQFISYTLSQDQYQTYSEDELVDKIVASCDTPRPRAVTCVQSLVAGGFCNGYFIRSKAGGISYKEGGAMGTPYTPAGKSDPSEYSYGDEPTHGNPDSSAELNRLNRMIEDLQSRCDDSFNSFLSKQEEVNEAKKVIEAKDKQIADLEASQNGIKEIHVKQAGKKTRVIKETFHAKFPRICDLANARKNIFLYGPTGCGKSHICEQAAKVLGIEFGFVSCSAGMSEGVLTGKLLPTGKSGTFEYSIAEFVRIYETGGLFLIDEIDAADANVLLVINSALANGKMAVPSRIKRPYAKRHPNFICAAAANTIGLGADRQYSGRNRLDDATMDRFRIGKVEMDYDLEVERQLCPDEPLRERLWKYRHNIRSASLERSLSTRFMIDAHDMQEAGWDHDKIDEAFFTGWKKSEVQKAKGGY